MFFLNNHPKIALESHTFGPSTSEIENYLGQFGYSCKLEPLGKIVKMMYAS